MNRVGDRGALSANGCLVAVLAATMTDCSWPIAPVHGPRRNDRPRRHCRPQALKRVGGRNMGSFAASFNPVGRCP